MMAAAPSFRKVAAALRTHLLAALVVPVAAAGVQQPPANRAEPRLPASAYWVYVGAESADLLHRLGRDREAVAAYQAALALSGNAAEQEFLQARLSPHAL